MIQSIINICSRRVWITLFIITFVFNSFGQIRNKRVLSQISQISELIDNSDHFQAKIAIDSLVNYGLNSKNDTIVAIGYNFLGVLYRDQNNLKNSAASFNKAIELGTKIKDNNALAAYLINLGSVYSSLSESKMALNCYFKALNIYKNKKKTSEIATIYNNIANIYLVDKKTDYSRYYLSKALEISLSIKDSLKIAMIYHNLGNGFAESKLTDSAIACYNSSLRYLKHYDVGAGHVFNYTMLAGIYLRKNNLQEAETNLNKAINITNKKGDVGDTKALYELATRVYEKKGDLKKAIAYYKLYSTYVDSMSTENSKAEIMKIEFDHDLKQQKIEQELVRKNREAVNNAILDSKNKSLYYSYMAIALAALSALAILRGYKQKQNANKIISKQKEIVEQRNEEILSSINYAKRIQYALLAHKEFMTENLPDHFVYFDPKDIVSGDFYWASKKGNKFFLGVCDSTGHGVPGAFMSLLNIGFLSEAINEKGIEEPNKIFDYVRQRLIDSISKEGQKDGFDGILLCIDEKTKQISYAAANNAPILIQSNVMLELHNDRMPVGIGERKELFTSHTISYSKGDMLYLYTDGFADQFGGPKGKKLKYKQLNDRLFQIKDIPLEKQRQDLIDMFKNWKGNLEQVDDVCVIGIKL